MSAGLTLFGALRPTSPPAALPKRDHGVAVHRIGVLAYVVLHRGDGSTDDLATCAPDDADRVAREWATRLDLPVMVSLFGRDK